MDIFIPLLPPAPSTDGFSFLDCILSSSHLIPILSIWFITWNRTKHFYNFTSQFVITSRNVWLNWNIPHTLHKKCLTTKQRRCTWCFNWIFGLWIFGLWFYISGMRHMPNCPWFRKCASSNILFRFIPFCKSFPLNEYVIFENPEMNHRWKSDISCLLPRIN